MLYILFKYTYYFTVDHIKMLMKMVNCTAIFEVFTHNNAECVYTGSS